MDPHGLLVDYHLDGRPRGNEGSEGGLVTILMASPFWDPLDPSF